MMPAHRATRPTYRSLTREFAPISMSDWAMALGDPLVALTLAALPDGPMNLAAFGIAKSIAVFLESPIIMVLHASNALSRDAESSSALWKFSVLMGSVLSVALLLAGLNFDLMHAAGVATGLSERARQSAAFLTTALALWPLLIALRRHGQGLLIASGKADTVAQGAVLRLCVLAGVLAVSANVTSEGHVVAGVSLISGLTVEWLFITLKARPLSPKRSERHSADARHTRSLRGVSTYYLPLAWTMISLWGCRLGITLVLADSGERVLAVWAAGWALAVSLGNGVRMVQQLVIRHHHPDNRRLLRNFVWWVGAFFALLFVVLGATPLGSSLLETYTGGEIELARSIQSMLLWLSLFPLVMAWQNALQGQLMVWEGTKMIGLASIVTSGLLLALVVGSLRIDSATAETTAVLVVSTGALEVVWLAASVARRRATRAPV